MAYMFSFEGKIELGKLSDEALKALEEYIENTNNLSSSVMDCLEEIDEDADTNYMGMLSVILSLGRLEEIPLGVIFEMPGRSFIDGLYLEGSSVLCFSYHASECGDDFFSELLGLGIIRGYRLYTPDWAIEEDDLEDEEIIDVRGGSMAWDIVYMRGFELTIEDIQRAKCRW